MIDVAKIMLIMFLRDQGCSNVRFCDPVQFDVVREYSRKVK